MPTYKSSIMSQAAEGDKTVFVWRLGQVRAVRCCMVYTWQLTYNLGELSMIAHVVSISVAACRLRFILCVAAPYALYPAALGNASSLQQCVSVKRASGKLDSSQR
jgi:hypothetical protein